MKDVARSHNSVIPAKAGTQRLFKRTQKALGPGFRRDDEYWRGRCRP